MNNIKYSIKYEDVVKKLESPVIKHVSKWQGWVLFKGELNVSLESYSDFSLQMQQFK